METFHGPGHEIVHGLVVLVWSETSGLFQISNVLLLVVMLLLLLNAFPFSVGVHLEEA